MTKKMNIIYQLVACILIFSTSKITAQTGVLTQNPAQVFHVDAAKDDAATITVTQANNDVVVTSAGNLGVGLLNPVTKVDLRSADQKGIIGVGTNAQAASVAGAGAIRYNTTTTFLEYSDGTNWIPLPITAPIKALVNASKSSALSIPTGTTSSTPITGWDTATLIDTGGNFNASNGTFTATHTGFYLVSFSVTLTNGNIPKNTYIETAIEATTSATTIPIFKTINSYPAFQAGAVNNYLSGSCNGIFSLNVGDTIKFTVKHNIGSARNTLNNGNFNNLSITEL